MKQPKAKITNLVVCLTFTCWQKLRADSAQRPTAYRDKTQKHPFHITEHLGGTSLSVDRLQVHSGRCWPQTRSA